MRERICTRFRRLFPDFWLDNFRIAHHTPIEMRRGPPPLPRCEISRLSQPVEDYMESTTYDSRKLLVPRQDRRFSPSPAARPSERSRANIDSRAFSKALR